MTWVPDALFDHDRSKAAQAKKTDTTHLDAKVDLEGGEGGGWGEDFEDWEKKPAVRSGQSSRSHGKHRARCRDSCGQVEEANSAWACCNVQSRSL